VLLAEKKKKVADLADENAYWQNRLADQKIELAKSLRTLYYSLRQLEDTYSGLTASLATAEQGYKITQVKFDIGMATKSEVISPN